MSMVIPKSSSLAKTLAFLTTTQPQLPGNASSISSLKLTLANRNAHYGARHFVKEELPRIAYAYPALPITVTKKPHLKSEPWNPELLVEFLDGTSKTIDMTQKHSSAILQELVVACKTPKGRPMPSDILATKA